MRKIRLLKHLSLYLKIVVGDRQFRLPVVNEVGFNDYLTLSEKWMLPLLTRLMAIMEPEKTFIDVGVNTGQTLLKVKAISPDCRYVGFEPNLVCVDYVTHLIGINDLTQTSVLPFGISERTGTVKLNFFDHSNTDSGASMVEGFRDQSLVVKAIEVNVCAVSDIPLLSELKIGILKVDVEGAEYEVLNSFKERIACDRPIILLEILPVHSPLNLSRIVAQDNIMKLLHELRYQIFRVNKAGDDFHGLTAIDNFGIHDDLNLCDYVMVPAEIRELNTQP